MLGTRCVQAKSHFSYVQLCGTLRTVAHQAPLSMGFSRQGYWSGLPFPPAGDLPDPGIEPVSLLSPSICRWVPYHERHLGMESGPETKYIFLIISQWPRNHKGNKVERKITAGFLLKS